MTNNFNEPGTISPIFGEPKYLSDRKLPLVTQYITDYNDNPKAHLTVENYEKWYSVFLIHADGTVEEISELEEADEGSYYVDHSFNPSSFHKTAMKLGAIYDNRTFALVCERWVEVALDDDWTLLHRYLPRDNRDPESITLELLIKPDTVIVNGVSYTREAYNAALDEYREKFISTGLATTKMIDLCAPNIDVEFKIISVNDNAVELVPIPADKLKELVSVVTPSKYIMKVRFRGQPDEDNIIHSMEIIDFMIFPKTKGRIRP